MAEALDSYVIRGVTNNIPLLRDIITEKRFVTGDISTKYLPQVYPEGFKGKQLNDTEREDLAALAACVGVKRTLRDRSFKQQQSSVSTLKEHQFEVKLNDLKRHIRVVPTERNGEKFFEVSFYRNNEVCFYRYFVLGSGRWQKEYHD